MAFERLAIRSNGDSILTLHDYPNKGVLRTSTVQYQISSSVLRETSPYFEAIFKNSFAESFPTAGKFHFNAHAFDALALKYLLIALHATPGSTIWGPEQGPDRIGDVWDGMVLPRAIKLDKLIAIADIMAYYQMEGLDDEIVQMCFSQYKARRGRWRLPRRYNAQHGKELMMWLSLGKRFGVRSLCDQVGEIICATCLSAVHDFGWPVPRDMLDAIDDEIERRTGRRPT